MTFIRIAFGGLVGFALVLFTLASLAHAAEKGRTLSDYNIQKESTSPRPLIVRR